MAAGMKKIKPVEPVISETQNNPYMDAITQAEASRGSDKPVTAAVPVSEGPDPWGYKPAQNYTTGLSNMVWNPDVRGMDFQEDSLPSGTRSYGRSSYSASSGGNGSPYAAAIDAFDYGSAPQWGGTEYERRRDEALRRAEDMKFSYDPDTDPSWQAYQKQYRREGQRATADALGQAAAMTGGVPSSYAVTAASQAGDYYAAQLSDKLPQLYQDAYNRYLQEYQRQLGIADTYAGYGQTEYNRYLDQLGQYNTDRNFAYGTYRDAIGDQRYADETAYARQRAAEEWEYQQARDAIGDQRYQTEWERKIADADLDNALAVAKYLGYVPEQYASILGVPAGTQYYTLANKTTGRGGGGGNTLAKMFAAMGSAEILAYIKKNFGEGVLSDEDWTKLTDAGINPDWLRKNGFRTPAQQAVMNNDSLTDYETLLAEAARQGGSYDVGQNSGTFSTPSTPSAYDALASRLQNAYYSGASADDIRRTVENNVRRGQITSVEGDEILNGLGLGSGLVHNDANRTDMSSGFRRVWPQLRNEFDSGVTKDALREKVLKYLDDGVITNDDAWVIINQLGLDEE